MGGKSSAVADIAAQIGPDEGRAVAHTLARDGADAGDLFGLSDDEADARALDDELAIFAGHGIAPPRRRAGRPPGSPNRATLALKRLLIQRGYRDPAEFLAAVVSMPTAELVASLSERTPEGEVTGPAALDALKVQVQAARELMPYWHQKMPIAVQHSGEAHRPVIIINDGPHGGLAGMRGESAGAGAMSAHEVLEYQELSPDGGKASDAASDAGAAHDSA